MLSNQLGSVFEVTDRHGNACLDEGDESLAGRVLDSMHLEHQCQAWLEGYPPTGRHGLFNYYEGSNHSADSMFNQHARWMKITEALPWRRDIASLNDLLSSARDGSTATELPTWIPDANGLLTVANQWLRTRHCVSVLVAGKRDMPPWLSMADVVIHCCEGTGIWEWVGNNRGAEPFVIFACCGDTRILEVVAVV